MELKNNNAELILFLKNVGFDNYLKYLKSKLKNKRFMVRGCYSKQFIQTMICQI